jgi:hypothetical protein
MSAPDPALLDRVRKLLALAGSPNAHEAAQAAARAQALVARHQLEAWLAAEDAVEADPDPITDGREAPLDTARRTRKWKIVLAGSLAEANGCVAWVWARPGEERICVVGRERDRAVVRVLWDALLKRVEWASATAGPGKDRAWHEAFRIGAADAIALRLAAVATEARADFGETALARIDHRAGAHREALDRFVREELGLGKGRALRVHARAYDSGRKAGAELPLPGTKPPER